MGAFVPATGWKVLIGSFSKAAGLALLMLDIAGCAAGAGAAGVGAGATGWLAGFGAGAATAGEGDGGIAAVGLVAG